MSDTNDTVLLETAGAVATVTLNRPDALNALDEAMIGALHDAMIRLEHDESVRCVVLRGAGDSFMAGGDIRVFARALETLEPAARQAKFEGMIGQVHASVVAIRRMEKPVIAAVHGAAAGFGLSLALAADLALATDDTVFTLAYCHIGTSPDGGSTFHLPRAVGMKRAMEIALLGDRFGAEQAAAIGLINRVVPAADLAGETERLAARLAQGPTAAYGRTKRLLNGSFDAC
ncbi:MAG: enoyl-CoA hydratase, partial [Inquilinus sp.]|nr:enoyl-CoA hydratase [Inquilinus sp.]